MEKGVKEEAGSLGDREGRRGEVEAEPQRWRAGRFRREPKARSGIPRLTKGMTVGGGGFWAGQ